MKAPARNDNEEGEDPESSFGSGAGGNAWRDSCGDKKLLGLA